MGHLKLFINEQTLPSFMGKMPAADWKQWVVGRPIWQTEDIEVAFEKFMEQRWKDAPNVAAAELVEWKPNTSRTKKIALPPRKAEGTKVPAVEVTIVDDRRKGFFL
jgi:hypothetical protein